MGVVALAGFFHEQKLRGIAGNGEPGVHHRRNLADARAGFVQSGIESATHLAKIAGGERGEVAPTDRHRLAAPRQCNGFPRQFAHGAGQVVSGPNARWQEDQQRGENRGALHARDHSTSRLVPPLE